MSIFSKILLSIFFFPAFFILGFLYGIFIVPVDMLDSLIWSRKDD